MMDVALLSRSDRNRCALSHFGELCGGDRKFDPDSGQVGNGIKVRRITLTADGGSNIDFPFDHTSGQRRAQLVQPKARQTGGGNVTFLRGRNLCCIKTQCRELLAGKVDAKCRL